MSRPYLHPADIARATGDHAAIGAAPDPAAAQSSPSLALIAIAVALWLGSMLLLATGATM